MRRRLLSDIPDDEKAAFQPAGAGRSERIAIDCDDPASKLEYAESVDTHLAPVREEATVIERIFEMCALRADGTLLDPKGMALRLCCLGSLLQKYPMEHMRFPEIADHCGVTRAAVSKVMRQMSEATGVRSRQQRSELAREAYRKRATRVHARSKRKSDAPEETPDYELHSQNSETSQEAPYHE